MKTKHAPRLSLADLLRRRKMSLKQLIDQFGITTYEALCIRCDRMGVSPPDEAAFRAVVGTVTVSSPTEGVIVLEAPPIVDEATGEILDEIPVVPRQKRKKKTDDAE